MTHCATSANGRSFAAAVERLLAVVCAARALELSVAHAEPRPFAWAWYLDELEARGGNPAPMRARPCPLCARGRPASLIGLDCNGCEQWGHFWSVNRHRGSSRSLTPEQIARYERDGWLEPAAFLCDRPSAGPFTLDSLQRHARRRAEHQATGEVRGSVDGTRQGTEG